MHLVLKRGHIMSTISINLPLSDNQLYYFRQYTRNLQDEWQTKTVNAIINTNEQILNTIENNSEL